jgi:hypothetical protein
VAEKHLGDVFADIPSDPFAIMDKQAVPRAKLDGLAGVVLN